MNRRAPLALVLIIITMGTICAPGVAESQGVGSRLVHVDTAAELAAALQNAQPGDLIWMADGTYAGPFSALVSGTSDRRITLYGTRNAVIQTGSTSDLGFALRIRASYWTLVGFTVTNAQQGVSVEGGSQNDIVGLTVHGIGQEAIKLFKISSYNTVRNNRIYNTGLWKSEWGEGVYVGSWYGHWPQYSGGQPDTSDYNQILNNSFGPDIRAEHIDVKEGTTGGLIEGNTFDGRGMVQSQTWVDSWVEIKGNGYTASGNAGSVSLRDGFQAYQAYEGWGDNNVFSGNLADLQASGYGFRVDPDRGHVVSCDNEVKNAGSGFANVPCM